MASLTHNQTVHISSEEIQGIYRVIHNEISTNSVYMVQLDKPAAIETRGRKKKPNQTTQTPKAPSALCGEIIPFNATVVNQMADLGMLNVIQIERENFECALADQPLFERRKTVMADLLDIDKIRSAIVSKGTIASLILEIVRKHRVSVSFVYRCWSLLCRFGFSVSSLRPRRDRCGAPGQTRDCEIGGRKKAGRKTAHERLSQRADEAVDVQPGMNADWRARIMIADRKIASPKPVFSQRYKQILDLGFTRTYKDENGELKPMALEKGTYPNKRQMRRVLEVEIPRLQRLVQKTTSGHYKRNLRAITGRHWEGVSGPGHTWAIDSTIGDIYLRSNINRAWIIGRPIVYTIVDIWSTAVVGFYVCLRGPSWAMAKVAIFNALARTELFSDLWGFQAMFSLNPHPKLPAVILGDNGEYKSKAAKETAFKYIERLSYTPPYRPDLKGMVEVMHRIAKDHQFWVEGAIDARRKEFEMRRFDPTEAVYTVRDYVEHLYNIYAEYNFTADRTKRLDTDMIADGVTPSPAGLWRWGHAVGIGTGREESEMSLIMDLLPEGVLSINRDGLSFDKLDYKSDEIAEAQWTAAARNFGSRQVTCYHYPGSVSRIWTADTITGAGLLELTLSDQARTSATNTYEEVSDAFTYASGNIAQEEHDRTVAQMQFHHSNKKLHADAKALTKEAIAANEQPSPSLSAARAMEAMRDDDTTKQTIPAPTAPAGQTNADADADESSHMAMLDAVLTAMTT